MVSYKGPVPQEEARQLSGLGLPDPLLAVQERENLRLGTQATCPVDRLLEQPASVSREYVEGKLGSRVGRQWVDSHE